MELLFSHILVPETFIYFYFIYILAYPRILVFGKMAYRSIPVSRTDIRIRVSGQHSSAYLAGFQLPLVCCGSAKSWAADSTYKASWHKLVGYQFLVEAPNPGLQTILNPPNSDFVFYLNPSYENCLSKYPLQVSARCPGLPAKPEFITLCRTRLLVNLGAPWNFEFNLLRYRWFTMFETWVSKLLYR